MTVRKPALTSAPSWSTLKVTFSDSAVLVSLVSLSPRTANEPSGSSSFSLSTLTSVRQNISLLEAKRVSFRPVKFPRISITGRSVFDEPRPFRTKLIFLRSSAISTENENADISSP